MLATMKPRIPLNYPGTSEQFIRDLVFVNNGFHLPANAEFGIPQHYTPLEGDRLHNDTVLRVYLQRSRCQPVGGHRTLRYKRMMLEDLRTWPGLEIDLPLLPYSLSGILPQINALYRTNLMLGDIVDAAFEPTEYPVTLVANPNSLAWQGEIRIPVSFSLALATPETELAGFDAHDMLNVTDLHGFTEFHN